jgi:hypothetical protein
MRKDLPGKSRLDERRVLFSKPRRRDSDLFKAPSGVLMQQARDQRLIRQTLSESPLLNRLQILARQADVQPTILRNVAFA